MSNRAAGAALLVVLAGSPVAFAQSRKPKATVTVQNKSVHTIHHLYLTPSDHDDWGNDQLGDNVIDAKKGTFKLTEIPCDTYDVRLVEEDGAECVVEEVDICATRETWTITDKDLAACKEWQE